MKEFYDKEGFFQVLVLECKVESDFLNLNSNLLRIEFSKNVFVESVSIDLFSENYPRVVQVNEIIVDKPVFYELEKN